MMKKMILVVVMLSMAMILAACDGNDDANAGANRNVETPVAAPEEDSYDEEVVVEYDEDYNDEDNNEDGNDEDEVVEENESASAGGFTRGTWNGNVFTSDQLGITFTMPDGWVAATDEEMAAIMGLGLDVIGMEFTEETLELAGITTVQDMMASNPETGAMVQIMAERLFFPNNRMSTSDYIDQVAEMLLQMDWEVNRDFSDARLGANTWHVYGSAAEIMPGFNIYGRYFVDVRDGFALTVQIVYSEMSESAEEIIAMFN